MENLNEVFAQKKHSALLEKWSETIKAVRSVDPTFGKKNAMDISDYNLAVCCENCFSEIQKYKYKVSMGEATQTSDVGPYIRHAFNLIAGLMPTLIADQIVSVQAIDQKLAQIFFLKYVYGSNKGATGKGSVAMGPYEINTDTNYTSRDIRGEHLANNASGSLSANLSWTPVLPNTVHITELAEPGNVDIKDNGAGKLVTVSMDIENEVGTIDYATGAIQINTITASSGIVADYAYNNEYSPADVPELDIKIESRLVQAQSRKLRARYSFDAAYDVEKQFQVDIESTFLKASVAEIKNEIDQQICNDLYQLAGVDGGSWNKRQPANTYSLQAHYESFRIFVNGIANKIFGTTKRVKPNFIVCGTDVETIIESDPTFVAEGDKDEAGCHKIGTYCKGAYNAFVNPFWDSGLGVIGFKGKNFLEAGYVYAPYLPVFATNVIMLDDFQGRRGFATSYAKAMLAPNFYARFKVIDAPYE